MPNKIHPAREDKAGKGEVSDAAYEVPGRRKITSEWEATVLRNNANSPKKDWSKYNTSKRPSRKSGSRFFALSKLEKNPGLEIDYSERKVDERTLLNNQLLGHFIVQGESTHPEAKIDLDVLDTLIDEGANINCLDKYEQTVLHEAARLWHVDVAKYLIEKGADVNISDSYGRTPLHVACCKDCPEVIELLLDKRANIEEACREKLFKKFQKKKRHSLQTPFHFAARNDATEACKVLDKHGANIEAKDYKGRTPVHLAAELGRSEVAKWLVEHGARVEGTDLTGESCITPMITEMAPVAIKALDTFYEIDRTNRKQCFHLDYLKWDINLDYLKRDISGHASDAEKGEASKAKTLLEVITSNKRLDIIVHPVIMKMLELKWKNFGRMGTIKRLLINLIHVLLWTSLAVGTPWQTRYFYSLPGVDIWRILVWILAVGMTVYLIFIEILEVKKSRKRFSKWKDWRVKNIKKDCFCCHKKWPEEEKYLKRQIDDVRAMSQPYFQDLWNFFDWTVYFLNIAVLVTHLSNVILYSRESRPPPCCVSDDCETIAMRIRSENLTEQGSCALPGAFVNNASLSVWVNRIFAINIIAMWLRLMKYMRSFKKIGPFVVMLGKIFHEVLKFLFLYLEFYIPYAFAFWMIFGGEPSIESMSTVDQMLFSLFRITLVDEYQYEEMHAFDVVMAYFLVGTFLGIAAILCINLFIAILSDTFHRVYDNANANALMQRALLILRIEETLSPKQKKDFQDMIEKCCPKEEFHYEEDLTESGASDMKKSIKQIEDQMEEVLKYIEPKQGEKYAREKKERNDSMVKAQSVIKQEMRKMRRDMKEMKSHVDEMKEMKSLLDQLLHKTSPSIPSFSVDIAELTPLQSPDLDEYLIRKRDQPPADVPLMRRSY